MELSGRVALVTGGAGGIGTAVVRAFAGAGASGIAIHYRKSAVDAEALVAEVERRGIQALAVQCDVQNDDQVRRMIATVGERFGRLDVLVNNAAVQVAKPLVETTVEEWDAVMASNLRSVFLFVKLAYPLMKAAGGGAVVNVSSVHAIQTSANIAAYAASKGGLLALTRAMAIEFAPDNIRVNAILPGAVDTPMLRAGLGRGHVGHGDMQDRLDNLARKTVSGKVGRPEEIAHAIYFLADNEQSSFMTGQALVVDGGATARLSTE
jgi:NAD(P)-dependent dehydrogenase (short-subunit alcohol dehydrogenase family)